VRLTSTECARCIGCATESLRHFRNQNPTFPQPELKHTSRFYDTTAVREWVSKNEGYKHSTRPNATPISLALFDERLAELIARKNKTI
jgi:hypothetical protein